MVMWAYISEIALAVFCYIIISLWFTEIRLTEVLYSYKAIPMILYPALSIYVWHQIRRINSITQGEFGKYLSHRRQIVPFLDAGYYVIVIIFIAISATWFSAQYKNITLSRIVMIFDIYVLINIFTMARNVNRLLEIKNEFEHLTRINKNED